jgi:hypothetical protein
VCQPGCGNRRRAVRPKGALDGCPTLIGLGLSDEVVPAKTVYAIANHLAGPHEIMEFPVSHSRHPDERLWRRFEARWVELAAHWVPPAFGEVRTPHPWRE